MARLNVEVVFAAKEAAEIVTLSMAIDALAIDALWASGLAARHREIDMRNPALGIFGKRVAPDTPLKDGDRIEIYRPLNTDPKALRRANVRPTRRGRG